MPMFLTFLIIQINESLPFFSTLVSVLEPINLLTQKQMQPHISSQLRHKRPSPRIYLQMTTVKEVLQRREHERRSSEYYNSYHHN
jgi:hypothetical protein